MYFELDNTEYNRSKNDYILDIKYPIDNQMGNIQEKMS